MTQTVVDWDGNVNDYRSKLIAYNGFGLGEVAESECLIELQNFKIKNE